MKLIFARAVKGLWFVVVFAAVILLGILMGQKGLHEKDALERKLDGLIEENQRISHEIKVLERQATLLRSDTRTIARAARRKLGMALPTETVYIFEPPRRVRSRRDVDPRFK